MAALPIKERDAIMSKVNEDMGHAAALERAVNELEQLYSKGDGYGAIGAYRPGWTLTEADRRAQQLWAVIETQTRAGWKSEPNGQAVQERLSQINVPTRDSDVLPTLARLRGDAAEARRLVESGHAPEAMAYYWMQNPQVRATKITGKVR
jgi:hypothetical protein